ncbi:MAG: metallophosphatase domain-containing protein [Pyrinomonadaceae bacterium]
MLRIVCLSDTHSMHDQIAVPDGDLLIHAGDATFVGDLDEIVSFNHWLGTLPHRHKFIIAGNHDWLFQTDPHLARSLVTNAVYVQDNFVECEGLKIYGSPWQPWFMDWAFNLPRGRALEEKWALIPAGTDVLVTHGPPYGILDEVPRGERVGCEALAEAVGRVHPLLHVFGHIHHSYGRRELNGVTYANAAICDEAYRPVNPPLTFDIDPRRKR